MSLLKIAVVYDGLGRVPGVGTERHGVSVLRQYANVTSIFPTRQLNNVVNYTIFYSRIKITFEPVFAVTAQDELQNAITFKKREIKIVCNDYIWTIRLFIGFA